MQANKKKLKIFAKIVVLGCENVCLIKANWDFKAKDWLVIVDVLSNTLTETV